MEKEKISEKGQNVNNPKGGEKGLNELRKNVKRHISNIKDLLVMNTDINTYAAIIDLTDKLEYLLYPNSDCKFEKSLLWAIDLAEDIRRVAGIKNHAEIYTESLKMSEEIRKFYFR